PVACQCVPTNLYTHFRNAGVDFHLRVCSTAYSIYLSEHLLPERVELLEIISEDLDRQVRFHARHCLVEPHGHRLGKVVADSGNLRQGFVHGIDEFVFGVKPFPLLSWREGNIDIAFIDAHGLRGKVGAADLGRNILNLRKGTERLLHPVRDLYGVGERDTWKLTSLNQDGAFIETGHEL